MNKVGNNDIKSVKMFLSDDVAHFHDAETRIPTISECEELANNTTITEVTINGNKCSLLTGINGNSVVIPYSGWIWGNSIRDIGSSSLIITSTLLDSNTTYYYEYRFSKRYKNTSSRLCGHAVRAVSLTKGVDLGLPSGLRWMECNVGATQPHEYGNYYAWGEISTKSNYSWQTYKFNPSGDGTTMSKYNSTDGLNTLQLSCDVDVQKAMQGSDIIYQSPIYCTKNYSDNLTLTSAKSILSALQEVTTSQTITFSSYTATLINASEEALSLVYDAINKGWTIAGSGLNLKTFSVASGKVVEFSSGNLQYMASTEEWRFAPNQYDVIGLNNNNISENYDGWIDLFGWGTSGYNGCYPYLHTTNNSEYGPASGDITNTEYDWGVRNIISGYAKGTYRTLTSGEWEYLFSGRTNASTLRTRATVAGVHGYIFLPDNWTDGSVTMVKDSQNWTDNVYSVEKWSELESAGAIFLPAAGSRNGTTVSNVGTYGYYWSSTYYNSNIAYNFRFNSSNVYSSSYYYRYYGHSVRLVRDVNS